MLGSLAVLVTVKAVSSLMVRLICTGNTGAMFASRTTTVKLFVAVNRGATRSYGLLLVTTVVIRFVLGLSAWLGVQVITPLLSMLAPAGGLINA